MTYAFRQDEDAPPPSLEDLGRMAAFIESAEMGLEGMLQHALAELRKAMREASIRYSDNFARYGGNYASA